MKKKRILILSDLHAGHAVGMTPPAFNPSYDDPLLRIDSEYRSMLYEWVMGEIRNLGKIDITVHNGDAIEGKGHRSGGTEIIEPDRTEQVEMAKTFLEAINTKEIRLTYGTPYHVGDGEDWEDALARQLGCPLPKAVLNIEINGLCFNFKHKVGGSQIPHGRLTAQLRDKLWNTLWAARGEFPDAAVQVRSHNHYFVFGGTYDDLVIGTPALQGYGSKFGSRIMSGTVDFGFIHADVDSKGRLSWEPHILRMPYQPPETL
jgi:hypothetical protein